MDAVDQFDNLVSQTVIRDRFPLRKLRNAILKARQKGQPDDRLLKQFHRDWQRAVDKFQNRRDHRPHVDFSQDLPILERRAEIARALQEHQVVVVSGETGSGKSTQLPKICLDAGLGNQGFIGHTQPRRLAARTIASRLADELQCQLGTAVGFKIRFTDRTDARTYIKLMTDGILLAETQNDRYLEQYEALIIDEAHERSLNVDFLLGYIKRLLRRRPELRLIITSATIDAARFAEHFGTDTGPAPVIEVSGRTYPVEVRYRPLAAEDGDEEDLDTTTGIVQAVRELAEIDQGHILVFLPTERDIRETAKRLRAEHFPGGSQTTEIMPLYARLSAADQNRVFQPTAKRRIVLATNVAESSLTVPGIRYVIDTGTARISRYAPRSKVQRLPIEAVSRASADQRKGRCGRVAPGICIRLFSEQDYEQRSRFTTPEIQRTNLASVILQAKALKLGRLEEFPFLDAPRPETIRDGYRTLFEIGAVDERRELTDLGRQLSRYPVDPRIARIILAADHESCLAEVLIIASALELQDPRERPHEKRQQADEAHARFADERSDFLSYLNIWDFYHEQKEKLTGNKLRKACQQNFLSFNRLREWTEIHRQLLRIVNTNGLKCHARRGAYDAIHRALLTGFLSGVAYKSAEHEYTGAGGIKFHLWPGSGLFERKPSWCVTAELVETTRRYGRTVAQIQPGWAEQLANHLVKRTYADPHFHRKSGSVMAYETQTLFGLPIVQRRRVAYGKIEPEISREIFIRDGLAARQLDSADPFFTHNEHVLGQVAKLAAKTRHADYLLDELTLEHFYDERIPADVVDIVSLRRWFKEQHGGRQDALYMEPQDLIAAEPSVLSNQAFPDEFAVEAMKLPVEYHFAPGESNDGVSIQIPEDGLGLVQPSQLDWLVPGLLVEKITALIRSLPKQLRRSVIPAPDTAQRVATDIAFGEGSFLTQAAAHLTRLGGETIRETDFRLDKVPAHLKLNLRVTDHEGNVKAEGRDLESLREELGIQPADVVAPLAGEQEWQRDGIRRWDFGELPKQVTLRRGEIEVPAFPTLIDHGEDVQLRLLAHREASRHKMRQGIRRLYTFAHRKSLKSQIRWLPRWDEVCLIGSSLAPADVLRRQVADLICDRAFLATEKKLPANQDEFEERSSNGVERIAVATQDVAKLLPKVFDGYQAARLALEQYDVSKWEYAIADVRTQLKALLPDQFLVETPWRWLTEYPRYLAAIAYRLERLGSGGLQRDQEATREIQVFWDRFVSQQEMDRSAGRFDPELVMFRWMIEEYRVSAFAQPLGTAFTVSPQRLEKQWDKVGR